MGLSRFMSLSRFAAAVVLNVVFFGVSVQAQDNPQPQNGPQSLPTELLTVENHDGQDFDFIVEIADDLNEQRIGLMHRESLADRAGMLFIYKYPQPLSFWMKNTLIPLDIIYVQSDGRIANIAENTRPLSLQPVPSKGRVLAVLEVRGGLTRELGIRPGDKVKHTVFGTIADTAK